MSIWVKIGLILIVLHLIAGFGWLAYKLSPRKKDTQQDSTTVDNDQTSNKS
jgi:uncharacterized membrane protein